MVLNTSITDMTEMRVTHGLTGSGRDGTNAQISMLVARP